MVRTHREDLHWFDGGKECGGGIEVLFQRMVLIVYRCEHPCVPTVWIQYRRYWDVGVGARELTWRLYPHIVPFKPLHKFELTDRNVFRCGGATSHIGRLCRQSS